MAYNKIRQKIERRIVLAIVRELLGAGFALSVYDGEETTVKESVDFNEIKAALFTTHEDWLYTNLIPERVKEMKEQAKQNGNDPGGIPLKPHGWVRLVYGNDGWDVLSDYTVNLEPWIGSGTAVDKLADKYEEMCA